MKRSKEETLKDLLAVFAMAFGVVEDAPCCTEDDAHDHLVNDMQLLTELGVDPEDVEEAGSAMDKGQILNYVERLLGAAKEGRQ